MLPLDQCDIVSVSNILLIICRVHCFGVNCSAELNQKQMSDSIPPHLLGEYDLCHQAVEFSTGRMAAMICGQEGNRTSGVTPDYDRTGSEV